MKRNETKTRFENVFIFDIKFLKPSILCLSCIVTYSFINITLSQFVFAFKAGLYNTFTIQPMQSRRNQRSHSEVTLITMTME